jgi:hypothetical protein
MLNQGSFTSANETASVEVKNGSDKVWNLLVAITKNVPENIEKIYYLPLPLSGTWSGDWK